MLRIQIDERRFGCRRQCLQRAMRVFEDLVLNLAHDAVEFVSFNQLLVEQELLELHDGVVRRIFVPLAFGSVTLFVVAVGMGVRPDAVRVNQCRSAAFAAIGDGGAHGAVGRQEIGTVDDFERQQPGEIPQQLRKRSARSLIFNRHGNRVAVVLNQENDRGVAQAGVVNGLPEFPFAGRTFARRGEHDAQIFGIKEAQSLGASHGLNELSARGGRPCDDIARRVGPVRRHLASAGTRVVRGADGLEQHVHGRHAQSQAERAVAVVRVKPVVPGAGRHSRGHLDSLMACAADLKEDAFLALEQDLTVVEQARGLHQTEGPDQGLGFESERACKVEPFGAGWRGERRRHMKMPSSE